MNTDECPRSADLMAADVAFASAMARAHYLPGAVNAAASVDPRAEAAVTPATDSRGSGGSPAGLPAPGQVHLSPPAPAAGPDGRHDPAANRAYTLTTRGWIAVLCAEAEPFVWPREAVRSS